MRPDRAAHGSDKPLEPDDPMMLSAAFVPEGDMDLEAASIVEEFARIGMPKEKILRLFESPTFAGTHRYYRARGPEATRALVERVVGRTGIMRFRIEEK